MPSPPPPPPPPSNPFSTPPQEQRAADEAAYRKLLVRLGVTSASRWTHTRPLVEDQGSGAELQLSPEDREALFRAYVDELRVRRG